MTDFFSLSIRLVNFPCLLVLSRIQLYLASPIATLAEALAQVATERGYQDPHFYVIGGGFTGECVSLRKLIINFIINHTLITTTIYTWTIKL